MAIQALENEPTPMLESPLPRHVLGEMYRSMVRARVIEQRIRKAPHTSGAILAGLFPNIESQDVIVTTGRHPVLEILSGADFSSFLKRSLGRKQDGIAGIEEQRVISAGLQSSLGVAAGLSLAQKRANSTAMTVAVLPGKSTKGTGWQEAAQFAAERRAPLIVVLDWTEGRSARSHEGRDLSHWPMPTIAVDGRDVIAVYRVTKEAISAARKGHGPTMIDCVNFLAPGYRGKDNRDPVASFRGYLKRHNAWSDEYLSIEDTVRQELGGSPRRR
jgi:TPP-dependent pyruvate/acetoin dehydrogenase alpha subunit